jgi:hypothetical protein
MVSTMGWRRLLAFVTIDIALMVTTGSAIAAPAAGVTNASDAMPTLLLLGVGLCGTAWGRRADG